MAEEQEKQRVKRLIEASRVEADSWKDVVQSFQILFEQGGGDPKKEDSDYTQRVKAYRKMILSCAEAFSYCLKVDRACKMQSFMHLNEALAAMEQGLRIGASEKKK